MRNSKRSITNRPPLGRTHLSRRIGFPVQRRDANIRYIVELYRYRPGRLIFERLNHNLIVVALPLKDKIECPCGS